MKTVLLTDCSFGMVPAAAQHFGEEGQNVIATMRDSGASKHLANRDRVLVLALDLRDSSRRPAGPPAPVWTAIRTVCAAHSSKRIAADNPQR